MVTREAEVLLLSRENFVRLFDRKYAQHSMTRLRERLINRLYLYIHRAEALHHELTSPFLKYLTFLLHDDSAVDKLKKKKRREKEIKKGLIHNLDDDEFGKTNKDDEKISGMLKMLDINPRTTHGRLPTVESGQRVINEIEAGLKNWVETTRRGGSPLTSGSPVPTQQNLLSVVPTTGRRKSFQGVSYCSL